MSLILIAGGDNIQKLEEKLICHGFQKVIHISGRKKNMVRTSIPENIDFILVLTDSINHNLSSVIKKKANEQEIPICFAKQSWSSIYEEIKKTFQLERI